MSKFSYRKLILLLADLFIISVSGVVLNYILSLVGWIAPETSKSLLLFIAVNDLTCVLMLLVSGAYNKLWRYFNIKDYLFAGGAIAVGFALSYGILLLVGHRPRKILWALFYKSCCKCRPKCVAAELLNPCALTDPFYLSVYLIFP